MSIETTFNQERYDSLLKTAKQMATIHNLLSQGLFQGAAVLDLKDSLDFIQVMHSEVMKELEPLMEQKAHIDDEAFKAAQAETASQVHVEAEVVSE